MSCNWELYELRVRVWVKATKYPNRGYVGLGALFWECFLEVKSPKSKDPDDICGFKSVFAQLAKMRFIPFRCNEQNSANQNPFGRIQTAQKNKESLAAAFLFVHRRDQSDLVSETTGIGVLLEKVTVTFTTASPTYRIHLFGDSGSPVNF